MQNEEPKLEKDDENVKNVMASKTSEAEAKATEVVEMAVSVAEPVAAEGTPEKAQVVEVVQVERQNAPDTQSSDAAEYMSRIERCHEEAMTKVQVTTEEAEESKEQEESNAEDACGRGLG